MATYFVRSSGGDDGNAGTSFDEAFATIQFALDSVDDYDLILICNDGTHLPTAPIDVDYTQTTAKAPIYMRGCAADGTDDGTVSTISGASLAAGEDIFVVGAIDSMMNVENLRVTAAPGNCLYAGGNFWNVKNCRFDNAGESGIYMNTSQVIMHLENCELDSCGDWGFRNAGTYARGLVIMEHCSVHDNGEDGAIVSPGQRAGTYKQDSYFYGCLFYDNAKSGLLLAPSLSALPIVRNCTFYGNTYSGLETVADSNYLSLRVHDCISAGNTLYGFNANGFVNLEAWDFKNICSYGNGSGHTDINSGTLPGSGHVLENPNFVSVVDGSENFTPQNTNLTSSFTFPSGETTYDYMGAIQPEQTAKFFGIQAV